MKPLWRHLLVAGVGLVTFAPVVNADCSTDNPCTEGCCSSLSNVCGYGPDYCGSANCIAAASTNGSCAQLSECDPGVYPGWGTVWGSDYASAENCPLDVCCSEFGFCGTTSEFCGTTTVTRPSCSGTSASDGRFIGYYEGWSQDRPCDIMTPEEIPIGGYTHLYFSFLYIDPNTYEITPMENNQTDLYSRMTALKEDADLEVWISIGGWSFTDPGSTQETFTNLAASESLQATFIASVINFLGEYGFDGVDLDWEYPGAPDRGGNDADFANYPTFLSNLKTELDQYGYGLSITIPASYWYLQYFDVVTISGIVDWFNMMTYDMHGTWDATDVYIGSVINPHTNLTEIQDALDLLWHLDIEPSMVNMGLAFYGRSFTLLDDSCVTPGVCNFTAGAAPGACTATSGILSFTEIEALLADPSQDAVMTLYEAEAVQVITYGGNQWVSYDNNVTFDLKMEWANSVCLGGTFVWAVDLDIDGSATAALRNTSVGDVWVPDDGGGEGAGDVYVGPDLWTNATQSIGCAPPCTFILPPYQLPDPTVIDDWPPITTSLAVSADGTTSTVTTTITVDPFTVTAIPWWAITVVTIDQTIATFYPEQSVAPPEVVIGLPGSMNTFPLSSTNYTSLLYSSTSTVGAVSSVSTPSPVQTGITSGCTEFYQAVANDGCSAIASKYGISLDDFYDWNPAVVGSDCTDFWISEYYCVAVSTTSTTATSTTPVVTWYSTSHSITITPQPTHTSIQPSKTPPPVTYKKGDPPSTGGCSALEDLLGLCGTHDCDIFGCSGHCGLFGCCITGGGGDGDDDSCTDPKTISACEVICSPVTATLTSTSYSCTTMCETAAVCTGTDYATTTTISTSAGTSSYAFATMDGDNFATMTDPGYANYVYGMNDAISYYDSMMGITDLCTLVATNSAVSCSCSGTASLLPTLTDNPDDPCSYDVVATSTIITGPTPTCYVEEDPDEGIDAYCSCSGYTATFSTLSGSSPCAYTSIPTITSAATTTKAAAGGSYTYTDPYGDVIACSSSSIIVIGGVSATECAGGSTTISTGDPPTSTSTSAAPTATETFYIVGYSGESIISLNHDSDDVSAINDLLISARSYFFALL
ncbi:hypothetical protein BX600DRAFT_526827, partial [Xylariales sp. PMI_506]